MNLGRTRRRIQGLALIFFTTVAWAQTPVPEHWSPYDYPTEIPAGVDYHIIVDGDTLWDLSAQYLNDPLLWPQLYQANPYIKDPDLIYPGDPIFLDVGIVVTETTIDESVGDGSDQGEMETFASASDEDAEADDAEGDDFTETVGERSETIDFADDAGEFVILPAGTRADMDCSSYLFPTNSRGDELPFDFQVAGGENRLKYAYAANDIVYLNKGSNQGISPGEEFSIRRALEDIGIPTENDRQKHVGRIIDQIGRLRIVAVQENTSTALIVDSCNEVTIGDFLVTYEQEPIPLITEMPKAARYTGVTDQGSGFILYNEDRVRSVGKDHLIVTSLGIEQNVAPGDLFIIYRENPHNSEKTAELPEVYLGHAVVLKVGMKHSVAKIIDSYQEINYYDKVVPYYNNSDQN